MRRTRLLVVEDHPATARGMKTYLELVGYDVTIAENVRAGRNAVKKGEFDVLVCDLHLPDGMGWDLLKALNTNTAVRAIAFSAYDEPNYRDRSKAAGFLEYVVKGSPPEVLVEAIERLMNAQPTPAAGELAHPAATPKATNATIRVTRP